VLGSWSTSSSGITSTQTTVTIVASTATSHRSVVSRKASGVYMRVTKVAALIVVAAGVIGPLQGLLNAAQPC
jgi:hypothetical protein